MCGFTGFVGTAHPISEWFTRAVLRGAHRGPDEARVWRPDMPAPARLDDRRVAKDPTGRFWLHAPADPRPDGRGGTASKSGPISGKTSVSRRRAIRGTKNRESSSSAKNAIGSPFSSSADSAVNPGRWWKS